MKKYLLFILLLLIIPFSVFAENCDDSKITIKDLTLKKSIGNTEELSAANLLNGKINLNLKMYEAGDSIEYTFKVKNESSEDYYMDNTYDSNHIEYKITSSDNSLKIPVNEEKEFTLTVNYDGELEKTDFRAGKFDASSIINLSVIPDSIYNPKTGNYFFIILGVLLFVTIIIIFTQNKKIRVASIILAFVIIPNTTHAACKVNLELNSNIIVGYVVPNPCTYNGNLVQGAEYTNGQYTYRYMQEYGYSSEHKWINIDNDGWGVRLTDLSSTSPVTSKLCTSINDKPIVSTSYMFYQSRTSSIDTSSFDTSNVINMNSMFYGDSSLTFLDFSSFDTSNVINFGSFVGGTTLETLDFTNFDFSHYNTGSLMMNVTSGGISSLRTLNMTNTILPENCNYAFGGLSRIEEIIFDNTDTSHVTNMYSMFNGDNSLTTLDLSSFDTSHVTTMVAMFYQCYSLITLDLSGFDTSNVAATEAMFNSDSQLKTIYVSDSFVTNDVSESRVMFYNCTSLVGGNGTTFTSDYVDKTYARIDKSGTPGYFTAKATS